MMKGISIKKKIELDLTLMSLIGKKIKVIYSSNKNQIGIEGLIIGETQNFLIILINSNKEIKLKKNDLVIELYLDGNLIELNCNQIIGTIQHRLKKFK